MEQTKTVAQYLGLKGFDLMAFYMAEYLGTKPDEAFYEQNMKGYLDAIDLVKEKYS